MSRRIQIATLTTQRISREIRRAIGERLDPDVITEFLSNVDWARADGAAAPVRDRLGRLEGWSTEYAEGDLSAEEYAARLLSLVDTATPARTA